MSSYLLDTTLDMMARDLPMQRLLPTRRRLLGLIAAPLIHPRRASPQVKANPDAGRKKVRMIKVVADSPSRVLRAAHILLVRIESAQAGPWAPDAKGNRKRTAALRVAV